MCETLPVPCMPAALAVMPGAHTLAVFEDTRKSKCNPVVRVFAPSGQGAGRHLAEIQSLLKPTLSDSATYDVREWRMAANAPVVVALDADGAMVVFRAGRAPQRVCITGFAGVCASTCGAHSSKGARVSSGARASTCP